LLVPGSPPPANSFAHLIRLSNQTGTLLLLIPSLWALVLASQGAPDLTLTVVFTLGAFFMRSAGVVMNDLADRSIDRQVHRTQHRPLASGALSRTQGLLVTLLFLSLSLCLLAFLNPLAIALSPIAFLLAAIYPFSKRVILSWCVYLYVCDPLSMCVFVSVCMPLCVSVSLSLFVFLCMSVHLCVSVSVCVFLSFSVYDSLSVCVCLCLYVCVLVSLSLCVSLKCVWLSQCVCVSRSHCVFL